MLGDETSRGRRRDWPRKHLLPWLPDAAFFCVCGCRCFDPLLDRWIDPLLELVLTLFSTLFACGTNRNMHGRLLARRACDGNRYVCPGHTNERSRVCVLTYYHKYCRLKIFISFPVCRTCIAPSNEHEDIGRRRRCRRKRSDRSRRRWRRTVPSNRTGV